MPVFFPTNPYHVLDSPPLSAAEREAEEEAAALAVERFLTRFPFLDFRNDLLLVSSFFRKQHDLLLRRGHYYFEQRRQALLDEFLRTIRNIPAMSPDYGYRYGQASDAFLAGQDQLDKEWEAEQRKVRDRELAREAARRRRRRPAVRRPLLHGRWCNWLRTVHDMLADAPSPNLAALPAPPRGRIRSKRGAPARRLCERSLLPPPSPEALLEQYERAKGRGRVEEKIRIGSMMLDLEASVDSSLIRDEEGEIVGRNPGLRGWFREHCRPLLPHYGSLLSFRRMAEAFRKAHGVADPEPATVLLDESAAELLPPARQRELRPIRREARRWLSSPESATAAAFRSAILAGGRRMARLPPPQRPAARGRRRTE